MSQGFDSGSKREPSALRGARILAALEATRSAASHATSEQRAASAAIRRHQAELEAVQECGQKLSARGRDLRSSLRLLREALDRVKLTAQSAGLLGAQLGDPLGEVSVVVGEEMRNLLARAGAALEEHSTLLGEVERERERAVVELARVSDGTRQASSALARSEEQSQLTTALLSEVRTDLVELFGTDPETAQTLAQAAEEIKTLAISLLDLGQRSLLGVPELRELLGPLLALVPRDEEPPQ